MTVQGRRIDANPNEPGHYPFPRLSSGDYGKDVDGVWYCCPPGRDPFVFSGCLGKHQVAEHEDGTITVSPSILISAPNLGTWHGFLERGVWREC